MDSGGSDPGAFSNVVLPEPGKRLCYEGSSRCYWERQKDILTVCKQSNVLREGWQVVGGTVLRWHPTGWHRTARQSLNVGCLGALGRQRVADLRNAWQQAGA